MLGEVNFDLELASNKEFLNFKQILSSCFDIFFLDVDKPQYDVFARRGHITFAF